MFMTTSDYLKRITKTLEHKVAPQIESDFARGQVLAAVFLLDQLMDRIEYKGYMVNGEIKTTSGTIRKVVEACREKGGDVPDELGVFIEKLDKGEHKTDLAFRDKCNEMLSLAIDYFFSCKDKLDKEVAYEVNGILMNQFVQIGGRDIGMLKISTSGKLIQTKD